MPYPATQIADAFIIKAKEEGKEISNLKLQKLLFIANGIHLVTSVNNEPLINEFIEVWPYGPVISNVYHSFKNYGNSSITSPSIEAQLGLHKKPLTESQIKAIDQAWEIGKGVDAIQLSNWSHNEGSPWYKAKEAKQDIISNEYIIDFFQPFVTK